MTDELDPQHDRVAAVTGAGTGIGQAIATSFGVLGWRVAVGGRRVDKLGETASLVEQDGWPVPPARARRERRRLGRAVLR